MQQERANKKAKHTQDVNKPQDTTSLIHLPPETLHDIASHLDIDSQACLSFTCRVLHDMLSEPLIARCNVIIRSKNSELNEFLQRSKRKPTSSGKYSDVLTKIYNEWDMFRGFEINTCDTVNTTIMSIIDMNSIYLLDTLLHGEIRDAVIQHLQKRTWGLVRPLTLDSHIPMIRYLIRECNIPWLAYAATFYDDYTQEITNDIFKMLIQDIKLPIDECFTLGQTALHLAVQAGNLEVTKALLDLGANDRLGNCLGLTPLHMAVLRGYREIVSLLLDKYDKTDICEWPQGFSTTTVFSTVVHRLVKEGTTPLHIAACAGNIYEVHLFHTYVTSYFDKDDKYKTPLWYAATNRHQAVAEYLLERHEGVAIGYERKAVELAKKENWKPPLMPVTYSSHIYAQHQSTC